MPVKMIFPAAFLHFRGEWTILVIEVDNDLKNIVCENGVVAALEAKRLAEKYQKDFLNCEDLVEIMSVGKNNIRDLMNSKDFPTIEIGNRKVVGVIAFTLWVIKSYKGF